MVYDKRPSTAFIWAPFGKHVINPVAKIVKILIETFSNNSGTDSTDKTAKEMWQSINGNDCDDVIKY